LLEPLQIAVRFLRPDIAIVHWSWTGAGDKNPDGTARQPRFGMMTMFAEKRAGRWLVVASQNDDSFPGSPPEFDSGFVKFGLPRSGASILDAWRETQGLWPCGRASLRHSP